MTDPCELDATTLVNTIVKRELSAVGVARGARTHMADLDLTLPAFCTPNLPAAIVPAGFTDDALPGGVQIIGRALDDRTVLRAAPAFEGARPGRGLVPPPIATSGRREGRA